MELTIDTKLTSPRYRELVGESMSGFLEKHPEIIEGKTPLKDILPVLREYDIYAYDLIIDILPDEQMEKMLVYVIKQVEQAKENTKNSLRRKK